MQITTAALGAATFAVCHAVEAAGWQTVFGPGVPYAPWFLNSFRGTLFVSVCLFVVSRWATRKRPATQHSPAKVANSIAAGGVVAMSAILFYSGPGSIFPIVLAVGSAVVWGACLAGAFLLRSGTRPTR
jgi:hypothetical protein